MIMIVIMHVQLQCMVYYLLADGCVPVDKYRYKLVISIGMASGRSAACKIFADGILPVLLAF